MDEDQIENYQLEIKNKLETQETYAEPAEWDGEEPETDYDRGYWAGHDEGKSVAWDTAMELFKEALKKRGLLTKYNWDYILCGDRDKFIRNYIGTSDYSDDTDTEQIK